MIGMTIQRAHRGVVGFVVGGVLVIGLMTIALIALVALPLLGGVEVAHRVPSGGVPEQYRVLVERSAAQCPALPAPLLAGQLATESGWNQRAISPAGAQGLAQFLPETWARHGVDGDGDGRANVWNAADAIRSAGRYDCLLLSAVSDIGGEPLSLMLAAYNAGLAAVRRHQGIPPYRETLAYVTAVTARAAAIAHSPGTGAASVAVGSARTAVEFAIRALGTPYVWGGDSDLGYDCSGLTQRAWGTAGVTIPRVANDQWATGIHPSRAQLAPGDLVFFATNLGDSRTIHHVGLYIGDGYMVHAPHPGDIVRFARMADEPDYFGATRPTPSGP
jgi:cell wall-associated NlpC family hydrolase